MERCVGKGKSISSGIALNRQVPYFVSLSCSQRLSLPTLLLRRACVLSAAWAALV